jgi:hypothetical protein
MGEMHNVMVRGIMRRYHGVDKGAGIGGSAGPNLLVRVFSRGTSHSQLICIIQDVDEVCTM